MSQSTQQVSDDKMNAIEKLRKLLPKDTVIYTVLRHVSRSGMFRAIDMLIVEDGKIRMIPPYLLEEAGFPYKLYPKRRGYRVEGCGMDMGFSIVYSLSSLIYGMDDRGGYALVQQWI